MEDIEKELEEKTIERDVVEIKEVEPEPEPEPVAEPPKKVKKPRSQKQIEAFERAKKKRAENIALKKKQKEEEKAQKKELKKVKKEPVELPEPELVRQPTKPEPVRQPLQSNNPREQVDTIREEPVIPSETNANFRLFESIRDEIDASYTRGRAQGGARGALPFQIVNTSGTRFKNLQPGQAVALAQVERNGTLGYYPLGQGVGTKAGITRIGRAELIKQIKAGKLKIDRSR